MVGGRLVEEIRQLGRLLEGGSVAHLADDELLERFATRRDGVAFEMVVVRHGPMVLATCRGVLKDAQEAEDAFQATFLTLARKAGSVRSAESLGPWLHRVARRIAAEANASAARRRRAQATLTEIDAAPTPSDSEDWPILHEEIDRLPERYRVPIVLCYLEGMTYEQAAGHLRWPVGTVGGRLARARELMRRRLVRRGVTASLAALASLPKPADATVPARWVRSTVAAASEGTASAGAVAMVQLASRSMLMAKLMVASTIGLVGLALGLGGWISIGEERPQAKKPAQAPVPDGRDEPTAGATVRVVDPEGRPVPGARVYRSATRFRSYDHDPFAAVRLAETGQDGSFRLAPDLGKAVAGGAENVVAVAEGFGPALIDPNGVEGLERLQLARDDVPIRGRVLDIDGRPVAGASVQVVRILWSLSGTLDEWLAALAVQKAANPLQNQALRSWSSDDIPSLFPAITTDAGGRFELRGIGRERLAALLISGPTIETRFEYVATRDMPTVTYPWSATLPGRLNQKIAYHGASCDLVFASGLGLVGTVRDASTGAPIPGVELRALEPFGDPPRCLNTTTDADGRYRLRGVSSKDVYGGPTGLMASSKDGPPYLSSYRPVGDGRGTITHDFALKRGVWVRGRVFDQSNGRPVVAGVSYFVPTDNPNLKDYPDFGSIRGNTPLEADPSGEFKIVAIPGRGILAARYGPSGYRVMVGLDRIRGVTPARPGFNSSIVARPNNLIAINFNTLIEINPTAADESIHVDIPLDPGHEIQGRLIGPDGEPVVGATMAGADAFEQWSDDPLPSAEFTIRNLGGNDRRNVLFRHEAKNLAGAIFVKPGEVGPLTVQLQAGGILTGRLVDGEGRPRAGVAIVSGAGPMIGDETRGKLPGLIRTDRDGRFRISAVVPGRKYSLSVRGVGLVVLDAILAPGEVKDLGEFDPQAPRKP